METLERSVVQYGQTQIPYAIRRSGRRSTVALAIEPTGEVLLTAPIAVPVERLDRVVHQKARWIVERWRRINTIVRRGSEREFVSGETFHYLGRQYRLRIRSGAPAVRLHRGWLDISMPSKDRDRGTARALLIRWYKSRAAERLPERVAYWAKKLDVSVEANQVLVRDQQKRWASCDTDGTLRFNWRVMQASTPLLDYVVAHELAHLLHRDHSSAFWRTLGRAMPDYESKRASLKRLGPVLTW